MSISQIRTAICEMIQDICFEFTTLNDTERLSHITRELNNVAVMCLVRDFGAYDDGILRLVHDAMDIFTERDVGRLVSIHGAITTE